MLLWLLCCLSPITETLGDRLCQRNICLNGGTCMVRDDESFGCICPVGFGGLICEVNCGCLHGKCDGETMKCQCDRGWIGEKCDIEEPIQQKECSRDLDCPSDQRCLEGISGTRVCMADPCHPNPCRHSSSCSVKQGEASCSCSPGFSGHLCEEDENECKGTNPCQNGGTCLNTLGSFECLCDAPFSGPLCDSMGCDSCGGGCILSRGEFRCACSNGTMGALCRPKGAAPCGDCLNGGKCVDMPSGHSCLCLPEWTGPACQQRLKCEVKGKDCQNGGKCIRGLGDTFCQCPKGFDGEWCERNKGDPCANVRCVNGGYCAVKDGVPHCSCPTGFMGTWCETRLTACDSQPCQHGGTCIPVVEGNNMDSFDCTCARGYGGTLCEIPLEVFQSLPLDKVSPVIPLTSPTSQPDSTVLSNETVSGIGSAEETANGTLLEFPSTSTVSPTMVVPVTLTTTTLAPVVPTTTVKPGTTRVVPPLATITTKTPLVTTITLVSTSVSPTTSSSNTDPASMLVCSQCVHSSRCVETEEGAVCVCVDGYKGSTCDQPTKSCSSLPCPIGQVCLHESSFSSDHLHCGCPIGQGGNPSCDLISAASFEQNSLFVHQSPNVMIGTNSGPLPYEMVLSMRTTVPDVSFVSGEDLFGQRLFTLSLNQGLLTADVSGSSFTLLPSPINDGAWYTIRVNKTYKDLLVTVREEGGRLLVARPLPRHNLFDVFSTRLGKISPGHHFVGCIADFFIDGEYRDMPSSPRSQFVKRGCSRQSPCSPSPCHSGECIDLWDSFRCECPPPLLPPLCESSLPPSTFGKDNVKSEAQFAVGSQMSETLKYTSSISFLLRTKRTDSVVVVLGEKNEGGHSDDLDTFIAVEIKNGSAHARARIGGKSIVDVNSFTKVDDNQEHLVAVTRKKNTITISIDGIERGKGGIESRFDHPLFADTLLIGTPNGSNPGVFTTNQHFKGSLQDIRVNGLSAPLHPTDVEIHSIGQLIRSENVLEGLVGDDLCSLLAPCQHGRCSNLFNEYLCTCEVGFVGPNCTETDFCLSSPCPIGAMCHNHPHGHSCTSPAHFVVSSFADFSIPSEVHVDEVRFAIRTHSRHAHILSFGSDYSVSLREGRLFVGPPTMGFHLKPDVANGTWVNVTLHNNVARINGMYFGLPSPSSLSLSASSLRVGSSLSDPSFDGCVSDIRVQSYVPLSFFPSTEASVGEWTATKRHRLHYGGCLSVPQCGFADSCVNGGRCEDMWNKRKCHCPKGFAGDQCEVDINECAHAFCGNGDCVDHVGYAKCVCPEGFMGETCETPLDMCSNRPCLNNGTCYSVPESSFACRCPRGFSGRTCAIQGDAICSEDTCGAGGICTKDETGFSCVCVDGRGGEVCESPPDPCATRGICGIHGECHRTESGYRCQCLPGYTGRSCETLINHCSSSVCSNHGKCLPIWNGTACQCDQGFTGRVCARRAGGCASIPCENDGECLEDEDGAANCRCGEYYLGDRCEVAGSCLEKPCVHGKCIQKTPHAHSCACEEGYEGERCETEIDMCESSPCANGATCESLLARFVCHCAPGFDGLRCDHDIDECASSPCVNGGSCVDRVGGFECLCRGEWKGSTCEEDVDECQIEGKCSHGQCTNHKGGYECKCEHDYVGSRCSLRNPCIPDSRNRTTHSCVHGDCVNVRSREEDGREWVEHECLCQNGYVGQTCAMKREDRRISVGYIFGPLLVILVVLCVLGCTLLFFVMRGKRALHGHYSPSNQEHTSRMHAMGTMLKLPPEERLI